MKSNKLKKDNDVFDLKENLLVKLLGVFSIILFLSSIAIPLLYILF